VGGKKDSPKGENAAVRTKKATSEKRSVAFAPAGEWGVRVREEYKSCIQDYIIPLALNLPRYTTHLE